MNRNNNKFIRQFATLLFLIIMVNAAKINASNHIEKSIQYSNQNDSLRISNWKEDLLFLKKKFETEHYNLFRKIAKKDWDHSFEVLIHKIPKLKDHEVITEAMKIISRVGDGHSAIYPPFQGKYHFHQIPVAFHEFKNGVYVKGASNTYKHLVGKEVIGIGDIPINEVISRLKTITPRDNSQWIKVLGIEIYMTIPEILYALNLTDSIKNVSLNLRDKNDHVSTINITADLFDISSVRHLTVRPDWVAANHNSKNKTPLYRKRTHNFPDDFYWFEHIKEPSMLYFQLNAVFNKPSEDLKSFVGRMFEYIETNAIQNLVIDLRLNSGGNNQLNGSLVNAIVNSKRINKKGNLFVIVGRRTFSAAMNLSTDLEQNTKATFVGEPTGSSPNFVGEDNRMVLPNSGIFASASNKYWQNSSPEDTREWITPSIINVLSIEDYKNNFDPNMAAIIDHIKNNK